MVSVSTDAVDSALENVTEGERSVVPSVPKLVEISVVVDSVDASVFATSSVVEDD